MPDTDFRSPRIFVRAPLKAGAEVELDRGASNHLRNVLRLKAGDPVLAFNGKDGEWRASLSGSAKKTALTVDEQMRAQPEPNDLHYLFAPIKHARLDYMVQKAVEMGVSKLQPVLTKHTQVSRINIERMEANVVEAAQQCGVLSLPDVAKPMPLKTAIGKDTDRILIFCDEGASVKDAVAALSAARPTPSAWSSAAEGSSLAVLIGPEGGFSEDERKALLDRPNVVRLALGPRILRADTAAVAALAVVQAVLGDWRVAEKKSDQ